MPESDPRSLAQLVEEGVSQREGERRKQTADLVIKSVIGVIGTVVAALLITMIGKAGAIIDNQGEFSKKQLSFDLRIESLEKTSQNNQVFVKEQIKGLEEVLREYRREQDSLRDKVTELTVEMRTRRQMETPAKSP